MPRPDKEGGMQKAHSGRFFLGWPLGRIWPAGCAFGEARFATPIRENVATRYWFGLFGEMLRATSFPLSELSYWMLAMVPTLTRPVTRVLSSMANCIVLVLFWSVTSSEIDFLSGAMAVTLPETSLACALACCAPCHAAEMRCADAVAAKSKNAAKAAPERKLRSVGLENPEFAIRQCLLEV